MAQGLAKLRKQSDICRSGINGCSNSCFWCFRNFVESITAQDDGGGVALETVIPEFKNETGTK